MEFSLGGIDLDRKASETEKLQVFVDSLKPEDTARELQKLQALGVTIRMDRDIEKPGYETIVHRYIKLPWSPAQPKPPTQPTISPQPEP